ncbi:MAG: hypothetical protein LW834_17735, partial [Cyanobium sp. 49614_E6]|nr:hypothetical protein [Cyanobium sp. 49614_E6]
MDQHVLEHLVLYRTVVLAVIRHGVRNRRLIRLRRAPLVLRRPLERRQFSPRVLSPLQQIHPDLPAHRIHS